MFALLPLALVSGLLVGGFAPRALTVAATSAGWLVACAAWWWLAGGVSLAWLPVITLAILTAHQVSFLIGALVTDRLSSARGGELQLQALETAVGEAARELEVVAAQMRASDARLAATAHHPVAAAGDADETPVRALSRARP